MNVLWRDSWKAMFHFRLRLPTPDGGDVELRQFIQNGKRHGVVGNVYYMMVQWDFNSGYTGSEPVASVTGFVLVQVCKYPTGRSEHDRSHDSQHKHRFLWDVGHVASISKLVKSSEIIQHIAVEDIRQLLPQLSIKLNL